MHVSKLLVVVAMSFSAVLGYTQEKNRSRKASTTNNSSIYISENEVNDNKVLELGNGIENAIINSDAESFMRLFDTNAFGELVTEETKKDNALKEYRTGFLKGFKSNIKSFPEKLIEEVDNGSYYDFLSYEYNKLTYTYYMLFRIYSAETGVNYHNYRVSKVDGKFTFNDIYVYLSGEELSETIKRFYTYTLPKKSLFSLFGENNMDEYFKLIEGVNLFNQGEFNKAYNKLNAVKGDFKDDKFVLIMKSVCAANISDIAYTNSVERMIEVYPNDPTLYLSQIDYYIMKEDYDTATKLLKKLKEETQDDFLDLLLGNLEFERQDFKKAISYFENITEGYPGFFDGHSSLLSCYSLTDQYEKCITILDFFIEDGYEKKDIIDFVEEIDETGYNLLEGLVKSNLYVNWKKK